MKIWGLLYDVMGIGLIIFIFIVFYKIFLASDEDKSGIPAPQ